MAVCQDGIVVAVVVDGNGDGDWAMSAAGQSSRIGRKGSEASRQWVRQQG